MSNTKEEDTKYTAYTAFDRIEIMSPTWKEIKDLSKCLNEVLKEKEHEK
jgi:hypothetical protein